MLVSALSLDKAHLPPWCLIDWLAAFPSSTYSIQHSLSRSFDSKRVVGVYINAKQHTATPVLLAIRIRHTFLLNLKYNAPASIFIP